MADAELKVRISADGADNDMKEILRQQMQLLAEKSKGCTNSELCNLTSAMVLIVQNFPQ